ncbi:MAG: VCBS repeat-containing protein [Bacteroidia bacterium]|nr:VCBS repeat-containing protein [Bacteroidia bacterium]
MEKIARYLLTGFVIFFSSVYNGSAQYCIPNPTYGAQYDTYIDSVRLGDIKYHDASSPKDTSYNDLTLDYYGKTHLTRGSTFTIYIQGSPYYSNMRYIAWIDYNNDKDFTDSNISNPDPCTNYDYGETEDYTVGISDFAKTATAIDGASEFDLEFFNTGDDADYDLIQIDAYDELVPVNIFNNNGSGTFSLNSTFLGAVSPAFKEYNMSYNLCDLNNDNTIDLLLTSRNNSTTPRTTYFQNNGTQLIQTATALPNLMWGSTATADFNNDGRQDVIICGKDAGNIPRTYIYMNSATGLVLANDKLKGVYGKIAVADYDNDRDPIQLFTGMIITGNSQKFLQIFISTQVS